MDFHSVCSDIGQLVDRLKCLGGPHLSPFTQQPFFPHTRAARAHACSDSLIHSEQVLGLLDGVLGKTQSLRDCVRLEHAVATNSICPALQIPDEIQQMIFLISIADEESGQSAHSLITVCRRWRAIALLCPQLWATINTADSIPMLQRSLQLSSNHPLQILFSRAPPYKLRWFEMGPESIQDVIQQIQQRRISTLSILGDAVREGLALRDAFGRGSTFSTIPAELIRLSSGIYDIQVDLAGVDLPNLQVFEVTACSFPFLLNSQLQCPHLSIQMLETTTDPYNTFVHAFRNVISIDVSCVSIHDDEEYLMLAPMRSLESMTINHSTASDTVMALGLIDTKALSTLELNHALAYDVGVDSPELVMQHVSTLARHFKPSPQYENITSLKISDNHEHLAMVLGCVVNSHTDLQLPKLEELWAVVESDPESSEKTRGLLGTSVVSLLSSRRSRGGGMLALCVPTCLHNLGTELLQATLSLTWHPCPCQTS
ncbi:hypothetical protein DL93DRAFT_304175 [Clavulina sp. PMI_390]|nr:hypothetical protein DL93DRAFT_304175 [Clavulina sp. PMI_390]